MYLTPRHSRSESMTTQISHFEESVVGALDENALVHDLISLVKIPSITGSAEESELQHSQALQLGELGFDIDLWKLDLDNLKSQEDFPGVEVERSEGYGLVAILGTGSTPGLVLQGHVDVVPTGDLEKWVEHDPFSGRVDGGSVHGRGACDMKAGLAANMAVARTIANLGLALERPLAVHTVVGEEDGGIGAFGTMIRGHRGDAAVLSEPTSGRIVTANAGALTFTLTIPGKAAHASMRLEGISAIDVFWPVYVAIRDLETQRNERASNRFLDTILPYPISIGRLRAGDWSSSVADLLVADGRLGVQLGENPRDARSSFEAVIHAVCQKDAWLRDNPVVITWPGGQFASGMLADDHPLINEVSRSISDLNGGAAPQRAAAPYGSDLRLYSGIGGIPTLHYGPGDVRFAHAPREQVQIAELITVARSLLLLTLRRCGAHL